LADSESKHLNLAAADKCVDRQDGKLDDGTLLQVC
jgi:hypothetical protein